jgi:hypothetical protein
MYELQIDKAKIQKVKDHQYYVFFPKPPTHANQTNRPGKYADEKDLKIYKGKGSNGSALLHPDVHADANLFMTALIDYGTTIDDWSMRSAVIQNGYRPDDEKQGREYLRIINLMITRNPKIFGDLKFPETLNEDAKSILGQRGDPRRTAFQKKIAEAPGWTPKLRDQLIDLVDNAYAPRGSNPHSTGFVFDLDFWIPYNKSEIQVATDTTYNDAALQSAVGMWLNQYSMQFAFDSYNTDKEIWHMEYRKT